MHCVSVTEFRKKLSHYLNLCLKEDVVITRNGETVAVLSSPDKKYYQTLDKLYGCLKDNDTGEDYQDMIGDEIIKRCGFIKPAD